MKCISQKKVSDVKFLTESHMILRHFFQGVKKSIMHKEPQKSEQNLKNSQQINQLTDTGHGYRAIKLFAPQIYAL